MRIARQPLRLLVEGGDGGRGEVGLIGLEEHPVADIDDEILGASRGRRAAGAEPSGSIGQPSLFDEQAAAPRARTRAAANLTARNVIIGNTPYTYVCRTLCRLYRADG